MGKQKIIAIFDIGKTNKKLFLFDEQYKLIDQKSEIFEETKDEDGFACEDLHLIETWIKNTFHEIAVHEKYDVSAINFSGYGASFVHIDADGKPLTPLYNYLKPYPEKLKEQFYKTYGSENLIAKQTASPVLGSLNSAMQLYRLKYEQPEIFSRIKYSLHLPQYLSFILSGLPATDITSIGCHTQLWNFQKSNYHQWVCNEKLDAKFAPVYAAGKVTNISYNNKNIACGIGLHDSSAALIPYLTSFKEPFVLISTGTWCISLNPFNHTLLSDYELHQDCLSYLSYQGNPVKASRLFAGYEHEQQVKRLAKHFHAANDYYKTIKFDTALLNKLHRTQALRSVNTDTSMIQESSFRKRALHDFETYEEAYHQLICDIVVQQKNSTNIILHNSPVKKIFVDGGFGQNDVYMHLLARAFPYIQVFAANLPQASAYGAAIVIHEQWNKYPLQNSLISPCLFKATESTLFR